MSLVSGGPHWVVVRTNGNPCPHEHPTRGHAESCLDLGRRTGRAGYGEGARVEQWTWEPEESGDASPWVRLVILAAVVVLLILCGGAW